MADKENKENIENFYPDSSNLEIGLSSMRPEQKQSLDKLAKSLVNTGVKLLDNKSRSLSPPGTKLKTQEKTSQR
jgi:hypothetical protein